MSRAYKNNAMRNAIQILNRREGLKKITDKLLLFFRSAKIFGEIIHFCLQPFKAVQRMSVQPPRQLTPEQRR